MTNADYIRSLDDTRLAVFITLCQTCGFNTAGGFGVVPPSIDVVDRKFLQEEINEERNINHMKNSRMVTWLQSEVEE